MKQGLGAFSTAVKSLLLEGESLPVCFDVELLEPELEPAEVICPGPPRGIVGVNVESEEGSE